MTEYEYQSPTGAAISFVNQGWSFFEDKAQTFATGAIDLIGRLVDAAEAQTVSFSIDIPTVSGLTAFETPTRPTLVDIDATLVDTPPAPDAESLDFPRDPGFVTAPTYRQVRNEIDADVDTISLPSHPEEITLDFPDAPETATITLPVADDYVLPDVPVARDITIPDFPLLAEIDFDVGDGGEEPIAPDLNDVGFTETPYTREVLDEVAERVRDALATGTTISVAVEDAIFARFLDRQHRANRRAENDAAQLFAGRGYSEPPGAFAARVAEAQQDSQNKIADTNREIVVFAHEQEVKAVQNAIVQGIALEQLLIAQHSQSNDRLLQAAKLLLDTHIALFNADVTVFNARQERRKTDAEILKAQIEFEVLRLERVKAQLDGQRLIGELNKNDADLYESQIKGVVALLDIFKTRMEGAKIESEIEETKMRGYEARMRGEGEKVKAYAEQWNGFTAAANAQGQLFQNFKVGVDAFATRITAHNAIEREKSARYETGLRKSLALLEVYRARIQEVTARLAALQGKNNAIATRNDSEARMYVADGQIESARTEANNRAFAIASENANNQVQSRITEAQIRVANAERTLAIEIEGLRAAGAAYTQLCASSMSAVNFSAGVSGSGSESINQSYGLSKSRGFSWSGETEDNNSPDIF
jgi:hypothetical protein